MTRESHLFACHKFLEEQGSQILTFLAKIDFRNTSEIEVLRNRLEEYVTTLANHALWEEEFIFNAFFTKEEVLSLFEEHTVLIHSQEKIMETLNALLELPPQSRGYKGKALYLEFRKFYASNLMHFYEEETHFLSLLQERADDETIRAIDKPIYQSMNDNDMLEMLELLLPPANIFEKKNILQDLQSYNSLHFEKALLRIQKILTPKETLEILKITPNMDE